MSTSNTQTHFKSNSRSRITTHKLAHLEFLFGDHITGLGLLQLGFNTIEHKHTVALVELNEGICVIINKL